MSTTKKSGLRCVKTETNEVMNRKIREGTIRQAIHKEGVTRMKIKILAVVHCQDNENTAAPNTNRS